MSFDRRVKSKCVMDRDIDDGEGEYLPRFRRCRYLSRLSEYGEHCRQRGCLTVIQDHRQRARSGSRYALFLYQAVPPTCYTATRATLWSFRGHVRGSSLYRCSPRRRLSRGSRDGSRARVEFASSWRDSCAVPCREFSTGLR